MCVCVFVFKRQTQQSKKKSSLYKWTIIIDNNKQSDCFICMWLDFIHIPAKKEKQNLQSGIQSDIFVWHEENPKKRKEKGKKFTRIFLRFLHQFNALRIKNQSKRMMTMTMTMMISFLFFSFLFSEHTKKPIQAKKKNFFFVTTTTVVVWYFF